MPTLERLGQEHVKVYQELDLLAGAVEALIHGKVDTAIFERVAHFLRGEASRHLEVEEKALFSVLDRFPWLKGASGPLPVMLAEHRIVKGQLAAYLEMMERRAYEDRNSQRQFGALATSLVESFRGHAQKEDYVLFPLAKRFINPRQRQEVERVAEAIYEGGI